MFSWPLLGVAVLVALFFFNRRSAWNTIRRTVSRTVFVQGQSGSSSGGAATPSSSQSFLAPNKGHRRIKSLNINSGSTAINMGLAPPPPTVPPQVAAAVPPPPLGPDAAKLSRSSSVSKLA
jgi:hypothetical protein